MKQDPLFCVEKKICIVTGGLGQLGSQFAKELLSRGARVAVFARHVSQEKIQTVFSKEQLDGKNLSFHAVDITDKATIHRALDEIERASGAPLRADQ